MKFKGFHQGRFEFSWWALLQRRAVAAVHRGMDTVMGPQLRAEMSQLMTASELHALLSGQGSVSGGLKPPPSFGNPC